MVTKTGIFNRRLFLKTILPKAKKSPPKKKNGGKMKKKVMIITRKI
jgi:hypothetical protein